MHAADLATLIAVSIQGRWARPWGGRSRLGGKGQRPSQWGQSSETPAEDL